MSPSATHDNELEVQFKPEQNKAVIEGKTAVPFQAFVTLVLQRKVLSLFKQWGKEPIIVGSELLTSLASAPQDSSENRANLITVSMAIGSLIGVTAFAAVQAALLMLDITFGLRELLILIGGVAGFVLFAWVLSRAKKTKKNDRFVEAMENLSSFLSK